MADTMVMEAPTEVRKSVDQVLAELEGIEIDDSQSYESAVEFIRKVKETAKTVDQAYGPKKAELYRPYKAILDEIKGYTDVLSRAEKTVRSKMSAYQTEQTRIAREAERKRLAEIEEARLAAAIESGNDEDLDKAVDIAPPPAPKPEEKPAGTYTVETWHFEITDPSKVDPAYMVPDERAIAAFVRNAKAAAVGKLGEGVRVYSTQEVRVKA